MYCRFILLHSAMHKYLWSSTSWTWPSTTLLKHDLSHGKEIFEIYFRWPTGKIRDWGINKSFQVFRLRSPTFWITRCLSTAISEGKGSWKGHVELIGSFFLQSNHHGRHRMSQGSRFGHFYLSCLYKEAFNPLPLGQPQDPSQVCEAMASKEVRHLGFGKLCCVAKPWKTSRTSDEPPRSSLDDTLRLERRQRQRRQRQMVRLLEGWILSFCIRHVLEMSSCRGTWKWKFLRLKEWCERCLDGTGPAPKMSPTTARTSGSQCVDPAEKSKNPWWFWRILWDFW